MTKTKEYVCEYYHDGSWWCLNIHAKNDEDAKARVAKLGNLKLLGELGGSIPACLPAAGFLVRSIVTVKNMMRTMRSNIVIERRDCRISLSLVATLNPGFVLVQQGVSEILWSNRMTTKATRPPSVVLGRFLPNPKLKLREQLGEVCRFRHLSHRTENAYWHWIKGFIQFHRRRSTPHSGPHPQPLAHPMGEGGVGLSRVEAEREVGWRHPREMGAAEVQAYLSHPATESR